MTDNIEPFTPIAPAKEAPPIAKPIRKLKRRKKKISFLGLIAYGFLGLCLWVLLWRFLPLPFTYLMIQRTFEGDRIRYHPVAMSKINPSMVAAVIAAEDARFCQHNGFEFEAMKRAARANSKGKKLRGASTISQQTAKNVFLWPQRSYVRKVFEAGLTFMMEILWGKREIMESYLNVAEMGDGVFGVEAASKYYFNKHAKDLSLGEASKLAAILPSPQKWRVRNPSNYVARRAGRIAAGGRIVIDNNLYKCVYKTTIFQISPLFASKCTCKAFQTIKTDYKFRFCER